MALPKDMRAKVAVTLSAYCSARVPAKHKDKVKLGFKFRGNSVTLFEERPAFRRPDIWVDIVIAQFRFDPETNLWTLYCADRNSRWHEYWDLDPSPDLTELLAEVEADPTGIFWG